MAKSGWHLFYIYFRRINIEKLKRLISKNNMGINKLAILMVSDCGILK